MELTGVYLKGAGHKTGVGIEQQCSMVQNTVFEDALGRTGDFSAIHQNIIPARGFRVESQTLQRFHDRPREPFECQLILPGVGNEGIV